MDSFQGGKKGPTYTNSSCNIPPQQEERLNSMKISRDVRKMFWQVSTSFISKSLNKNRIKRRCPYIEKSIGNKPVPNIHMERKKEKNFSQNQEQDKDLHFHHILFNITVTGFKQKKKERH